MNQRLNQFFLINMSTIRTRKEERYVQKFTRCGAEAQII